SGSFAQQALLWLVALKLLGLIVVFSTVVQFGFDLPKSLWSKALEWPMAAILAIGLLRYGTAIVPRTRLHVLVAAFVAANVVATVFAPDTYVALFTGRRARVVAAVVAAAALAMVLVSGTRGALLADGGALLVLAALWVRAHGLRLSPRLVLGIAGALLVAALGALASPPGQRLLSA